MDQLKKREEAIGRFFSKEASGWGERHDDKGIPASAKLHVDAVIENNSESVIDVGAGPATVLLKMIEGGVKEGTAVDLSEEMCREAERRVRENSLEDRVRVVKGSFLEVEVPVSDAVSLHRVLCCHPDREGMIERALMADPSLVVITIPRSFAPLRLLVNLIIGIKELFSKGFRPYIHKESEVIAQMQDKGFNLEKRTTKGPWVTLVFKKQPGQN